MGEPDVFYVAEEPLPRPPGVGPATVKLPILGPLPRPGRLGVGDKSADAAAVALHVVAGRHDEPGQALAAELRELGPAAEFVRADVRYDDQLEALVDATVERFGRLDIAVNNAGTDRQFRPIPEITGDMYATTFDTNVLGTLLSMKHELRVMREQESGAIVNVISIYGDKGFPDASLYVASKHAIIGLTRSAALEAAAYGVRVNAVGPGPVQTAMLDWVTGHDEDAKRGSLATVPMQRAGDPDEIAKAIAFIAGADAGFLTGQTVFLDGGMMAA